MKRIAITVLLLIVSVIGTAPTLWADKLFEVKGTATATAMPDVAHFTVPLSASANGWIGLPRVTRWELVRKFKDAGALDAALKECSNEPYPCISSIGVQVSDFSMLRTLAQIATENDYKGWTVFYDLSDPSRVARKAKEAALAVAREKAALEARRLGRQTAILKDIGRAHICSLALHDEPSYCYIEGEEPTEEVVVTAFRRDFVRTNFDVPAPDQKKMSATVDATFELK